MRSPPREGLQGGAPADAHLPGVQGSAFGGGVLPPPQQGGLSWLGHQRRAGNNASTPISQHRGDRARRVHTLPGARHQASETFQDSAGSDPLSWKPETSNRESRIWGSRPCPFRPEEWGAEQVYEVTCCGTPLLMGLPVLPSFLGLAEFSVHNE